MKRIVRTFALVALIGCCAFSVSSLSVADAYVTSIISEPDAVENALHVNVFQYPFLLKPIEPESAKDDSMVRSPSLEEPPFRYPFLITPHDAPEESGAVFVSGESVSGAQGASDNGTAPND